jgi:ribonuclease HII
MAGPLVAAAVRFDYERLDAHACARLPDLNDSKKLSPRRRAALLPIVFEVADMVVSVVIPASQIDQHGLHVSNMRALGRALEAVAVDGSANLVDGSADLVDGFELKAVGMSPRPMVRGDQTSAAIAAASIVAKETRDWLMRQLDVEHPGYGFAVHKGYITPAHVAAVAELGLSPAHRRSVRRKALAGPSNAQIRNTEGTEIATVVGTVQAESEHDAKKAYRNQEGLGQFPRNFLVEAIAESGDPQETEAAPPKPKMRKKAPEWKSLPDAEKAQYLLDHQTLSDRTWTGELRLKGEKRDAFVRRILLGEVLHAETVESGETETAY